MQHLKDDMDELFRKAADEYPLNTGNPDWNKVAQGLAQEPVAEPPVKKTYRRYTWLLLLLPLGFLLTEMVKPGSFRRLNSFNRAEVNTAAGNKPAQAPDEMNTSDKGDAAKKAIAAQKDNVTGDADNVEGLIADDQGDATREEVVTDKINASRAANAIEEKDAGRAANETKKENGIKERNDTKKGNNTEKLTATGTGNAIRKGTEGSGNPPVKPADEIAGREGNLISDAPGKGATAIAASSQNTKPGIGNPSAAGINAGTENALISPYTKVELAAPGNSPDLSQIAMPQLTKLEAGPIKKQRIKTKNFYVGTIGGLDLTAVSFQKTSDVGYHFGGMAGYTFSRKWSVEVGFIVEKKSYYTDGKYFDKSGLRLGPNTTVVSVDGDCKMFEIPFSVKYDITNTYKSNFFVTGGFSSYIMKKEEYEMVYQYGSGSRGTHYYPYENSSKNFFAELRLTGGYAVKLPQHFSLRIEPYLNIPVTGVGYGKLHLMSAGLNAGIFKRIF